jgi:HK97 family phage major capsid protein
MEGNSFYYATEGGSLDRAAETLEGAVKPAGDLQLGEAQAIAQTIPAWMKLRRQQLADVPGLGVMVQQRLTYMVLRRLENQIVGGDGTGTNLTGILHTTGIASVAFAAGTALSDLALAGITAVLQSEAEPDAVVVNPADRDAMLAAKATGGGERLDSAGAFSMMPDTIWA